MTDANREVFRSVVASVIASMVVSVVGGAIGMYVGFRLLDYRITQHDHAIESLQRTDSDLRALTDKYRDERMAQIQQLTEATMTIRSEIAGLKGFLEARLPKGGN